MECEKTDQRLERPGATQGDEQADPEMIMPDEDRATGSEGTGRLIGLGESRDRRRRNPEAPSRLPD